MTRFHIGCIFEFFVMDKQPKIIDIYSHTFALPMTKKKCIYKQIILIKQAGGQWNVLDTDSASLGPLVETAIQRSPILYIRNG